jgi:TonB family protein
MRLGRFVISFCLHASFVLLVLFWPSPPPSAREPQAMTVSLVEGLPGGSRTPEPILSPREAPTQTQTPLPPSAPPEKTPPPVAPEPPPEAVPVPVETAPLPKLEAPVPVRQPQPEKVEKPETPKEADKKPEAKKPEAPKDPVKEALDRASASAKPAVEAKVKTNAVAQALAAARKQSGGEGGADETGGGIGDAYAAQIVMAVQPNWHWPAQAQGNLSVALYLKIDATGRVLNVRVEESSGNSIFDSSAVSAVRVTQMLPPPPSPVYREIILRFFPMQ